MGTKESKKEQICFRLTSEEKNNINNYAQIHKMTMTEYISTMSQIESEFKEFIQLANNLNDRWENKELNPDEAIKNWSELNARYSKLFPIIYNMDSYELDTVMAQMNRLTNYRIENMRTKKKD